MAERMRARTVWLPKNEVAECTTKVEVVRCGLGGKMKKREVGCKDVNERVSVGREGARGSSGLVCCVPCECSIRQRPTGYVREVNRLKALSE